MWLVCVIKKWHSLIENYGLKVGIILKISLNTKFLSPNCTDISRLKFVDSFRPQCIDSSCN